MRIIATAAALLAGLLFAPAAMACEQSDGVTYICDVSAPEDLVAIPGKNFIIASSVSFDPAKPGKLVVIDTVRKAVSQPRWRNIHGFDSVHYDCPGFLPEGQLAPQGINIMKQDDGYRLLVVNHRPREAIEVFRIFPEKDGVALAWEGCVVLPEGSFANSVSALPDGGLVATFQVAAEYYGNAAIGDPIATLQATPAGQVTGHVATWRKGEGWKKIAGSEGSVPNGVEAMPDGSAVWAAFWGDRRLVRFPLEPGTSRAEVKLDYLTDNLRWGADGYLWSAGQHGAAADMPKCLMTAGCRLGYSIARIDPRTGQATIVPHPDTLKLFDASSVALQRDGGLWLGALRGDRVTFVPRR